jgi:hypothetical protein
MTQPGENRYKLRWCEVLSYRETRCVLFGAGEWVGHVADFRGPNLFHGRIPKSPTFATVQDALAWADTAAKAGRLAVGQVLKGHYAGGEGGCSKGCTQRHVASIGLNSPKHPDRKRRKAGAVLLPEADR